MILTERLILKPSDPAFAGELVRYYTENAEYFAPYNPAYTPDYCTVERQEKLLENEICLVEKGRGRYYYMFLKDAPDRLSGIISFVRIRPLPYASTIFGYDLDHSLWGLGIATEGCRAAIEDVFANTDVHRIEARVSEDNSRSEKLLEKLGFTYEGIEYKSIFINGQFRDHKRYALLRP